VMILTFCIIIIGIISFKELPIEAYPNVDDTKVQVISQWEGNAAEEVERQITMPLEIALNGVAHHTALRSVSMAGISIVTLVFDEKTAPFAARQYILEKLQQVKLPDGVQMNLSPMSSSVGQIYWYILDSPNRSPMELKEIQDWDVEKRWKEIPLVADVTSFGGQTKQYQILLSPVSLARYGISTRNVAEAVANNNQNIGGGYIRSGEQSFNIKGVGKTETTGDLENIIIAEKSGTPIRIKNLGEVQIAGKPRLGKISMSEHMPDGSIHTIDDAVEGTVLSRTGEPEEQTLKMIHDKAPEIEKNYLPSDVKIKPFLDRSKLIHMTTDTVEENMGVGVVLVVLVLLFFLGDLRSALIVSSAIPISLLFASMMLNLKHIPANLLSLGALDFGMIVDGAVIMVENIFRHKQKLQHDHEKQNIIELIATAAREVERPLTFAVLIIIISYLPIFTMQRVEGKLFTPLAWTVVFALLGSLICALTVIPILCSVFLKGEVRHWRNPVMVFIEDHYKRGLEVSLRHKKFVILSAIGCFMLTIYLAFGGPIGSEFLPHLNEGSIWVRGTLPPSASFETANNVVGKMRSTIMEFEEVPKTVCQLGRPDDGTDASGFFNTECFIDLKPQKEWRKKFHQDKDKLIEAINKKLSNIPGVVWNFSQPISDNVEESMSGVKGALVVKLYGEDLPTLTNKAEQIKKVLAKVSGIQDLGIFEEMGQPNVNIVIDRDKISRYGLNISDVQGVIETAIGGKVVSQMVDNEKHFDIVVRYLPGYRETIKQIQQIIVNTPDGYRIPLKDLTTLKVQDNASIIYRENNGRYIAVKFSVRGRDLGSAIDEAQKMVNKDVILPPSYRLKWAGEFESKKRSEARLAMVVPITVAVIFFILFLTFGSFKWASIIMADVATARMGGVLALFLTGTNFSVSSGIGFLAVFGVSVQTGMLLTSSINNLRVKGLSIDEAVKQGSVLALRPIIMIALVATLGLLPAALSHAIGSDSQRPMAIVIVGGLLTDLVIAFFLLPTLYTLVAKPDDKLKSAPGH
jgi:heavy metal efflux system protein